MMKNLLMLSLVLLAFTACETETDLDTSSEFQPEAQLLFSTENFEQIENNYPDVDKTTMDRSLALHTENGQTLYSMDVVNNTDVTNNKVAQSQLFFTVENNQVGKSMIIESHTVAGTNNVNFKIRNDSHQVFAEYTLVETEKGIEVQWQMRSCFGDCIQGLVDVCQENIFTIIGCSIASPVFIAMCGLECAL
ncbi:hypothetical protein [Dokdonia sp.]|uniref:hypothetical protein n=1 Tax=Dokdonia sp. TaxID=2024995 RepID=UPI003264BFB4